VVPYLRRNEEKRGEERRRKVVITIDNIALQGTIVEEEEMQRPKL